ncbi:MAG TPA: LysM peptidoglycan-binding domain-containing protein [Desulfitobacterium dehalogenans]|uniref:LysM peptidoglycan-binding domain-containing protein n=1 Tax=Desulfitobacterium dehalogenans TaxID=36854 RepID=A0A7C7DAA0_9FIRM|nr:LysM peptidoglycan-binding domain-containing protein [Desulfitobacterium dehalogenans]
MRKFIFKDGNRELLLPVTPPSFAIDHGIRIETIHIHTLGDVNIAGYGTLAAIKIDCLFPARPYPFSLADENPYTYVKTFQKFCDKGKVIRFIIPDTPVNLPVLVESITYSERDGTHDVYASLALREYRPLSAVKVEQSGTENQSRPAAATVVKSSPYIVESGDTLSAICRKFYGDANLYPKVADANGLTNPHLIFPGQKLNMPDKSQLVQGG